MVKNSGHPYNDVYYVDDPDDLASPYIKKKKVSSLLAFVLLLVTGTYFVQTTLAANISLNSGASVEYGQGILQTVACSGATKLTITPNSTFSNASGAGDFYFSSITVSNIPVGCYGQDFTLRAYGNTNSNPLALFNTTATSAVIGNEVGTFKLGPGSTGMSINSGSGTFTATFTSPVALASTVFRITVESASSAPVVYNVGDTGPGGGVIFYVAPTPFDCGPTLSKTCTYLEAAPTTGIAARLWTDVQISWATNINSNQSTSVPGASGLDIGTGYKNSIAINDQTGNDAATSAAVAARGYRGPNNLTDWFLPSWNELNQLRINKTIIGSVADAYYWSSSEMYPLFAWRRYFSDSGDNQGGGVKSDDTFYVRPIRSF